MLHFNEGDGALSKVTEAGDVNVSNSKNGVNAGIEIPVCALDEVCGDEKITFIKMDVEGSEYKALLGAEKIISCCKPKLAISIYHNPEDIWELPELILKMNPDYKFYIRHYSLAGEDTVLYAIP